MSFNLAICFGWRRWRSAIALLLMGLILGHGQLAAAPASEPRRITTVAGQGKPGRSGEQGPATNALLANPYGIVRGPDAGLYVCEVDNHIVRRIARDGTIATVAGSGMAGYSGDGGPALEARLNEPYEVRFDSRGNLFWVEMKNHIVRRVDLVTRQIKTVAGTGQAGFSGDGDLATRARLAQPHSLQFDPHDNLYICDIGNHRIRRVDATTGRITTFAGTGEKAPTPDGAKFATAPLYGPRALDFDRAGNLWLALREGNAVYKLDLTTGTIHHVAGTGKSGFTGNGGPAKSATLSGPKGLSVGPDGNIYLADTESHSVRMINLKTGTLELIAGTGQRGDGPEGAPLGCRMARPHGVFVDVDGAIYIGDSEAHRVRVVR
jgi:streptogramin lyase